MLAVALASVAAAGHGWGFLEWFFVVLLGGLVALVGVFFLFLVGQLFLNPGRRPRRL